MSLGLLICKAYVGLLGGKILLDSEPGKESIFYFRLPSKTENQSSFSELQNTITRRQPFPKLKTILVAEDDINNFKLISNILKGLNVVVKHAFNGEEAVEKCKSNKDIDLVLMDSRMPDTD
jgi:PleD family two-component response regulator